MTKKLGCQKNIRLHGRSSCRMIHCYALQLIGKRFTNFVTINCEFLGL